MEDKKSERIKRKRGGELNKKNMKGIKKRKINGINGEKRKRWRREETRRVVKKWE